MAIEEEANQFHELWLKNYKNYFRRIKEIDRTEATKQLKSIFFENFLKISNVKACHTFVMLPNDIKKAFNNSNKRFQAIVWTMIFDEYELLKSHDNKKSSNPPIINLVDNLSVSTEKPSTFNTNGNEAATELQNVIATQATANANPMLSSTSNDVAIAIQAESSDNQKELLSPLTISVSKTSSSNLSCPASKQTGNISFNNGPFHGDHPFDKLSAYLNIKVDEIKVKVFEFLNKSEVNDNLVLPIGNFNLSVHISKVSNFIMFFIPAVTSTLIDAYNKNIQIQEADAMAEALLKSDAIESTSSKVAEAISNETTMESPRMSGFIRKNVKNTVMKELAKNERGGKKVTFQQAPKPSNNPNSSNKKHPKKRSTKNNPRSSSQTDRKGNKNHSTTNNNRKNKNSDKNLSKKRPHQQSNQGSTSNQNGTKQQKRKASHKLRKWVHPKGDQEE